MNLFRKIFQRKPKQPHRDEWEAIIDQISSGFERVRTLWFIDCKLALTRFPDCKITNRDLIGNALTYAKTFQLYNGFLFVGKQQYISPSDGRDFADMLFKKECAGVETYSAEYQMKLTSFKGTRNTEALMFVSDISVHLTGSKDAAWLMAMMPTLVKFVAETNLIVANAFGDTKTSAKIKSHLVAMK